MDRWIFWTDIGKQPKIERSSLEGKERNVLVLHGLILPVSITVDTTNNIIYWTDPIRGTIESCDFYGNNRKVLRTDINAQYYGIEVYKVRFSKLIRSVYICFFFNDEVFVQMNKSSSEVKTIREDRM